MFFESLGGIRTVWRCFSVIAWNDNALGRLGNMIFPRLFSYRNRILDSVLEEVCLLAEAKGIRFVRPQIRQVYPEANVMFQTKVKEHKYVCGVAFQGGLILILPFTGIKTRMQLAILIAHELGHIVDYQTRRKGHPFLESPQVKGLDGEGFADAFACYLFGKLVFTTASRSSGFPYDEPMILNLDLNV